jgi:kinesin family protein 3/17
MEREKLQVEKEKDEALTALKERSREWLQEREDRKALLEKITQLESKILVGGRPQDANESGEVGQEYEKKFLELEKERQQLEEDRAQVDQYKQ